MLSHDVVVDDEWSITSTILQETIKQLEVICGILLSDLSWMICEDQQSWLARLLFSPEKKIVGKKDGFHCFCCCKPTISHRMMNRFMDQIIDWVKKNIKVTKRNGYISLLYSVIRLEQN